MSFSVIITAFQIHTPQNRIILTAFKPYLFFFLLQLRLSPCVRFLGQVDDCRTNPILCGLPLSFPTDRRIIPEDQRSDNISAIANNDKYGGLVFTCAKAGQLQQSYARPGERCQNDLNGECADADCTKPKSNVGFWRLDLDLQFACSSNKPCQSGKVISKAKGERVQSRIMEKQL